MRLDEPIQPARVVYLGPGAVLLGGFVADVAAELVALIGAVAAASPFRHMVTAGGRRMSVAMTNCGPFGWTSDARGYRYADRDPLTERAWLAMPVAFAELADRAARAAGFTGFSPDACLVNRYAPGARLSLHQDRDERDGAQPIVSVFLGLPAIFLWGGTARADRPRRVTVLHGDVVVWGGPSRYVFHGVDTLPAGDHPGAGGCRLNLTFRKAR